MAENIMLNLGIGLDSEQAEMDASRVLNELQDVLGKTLDIEINTSDFQELGKIINNANGQISVLRDNLTGFAKSISATWEDANGQLVKYTQNLRAVTKYDFAGAGVDMSLLDPETAAAYNAASAHYEPVSSRYSTANKGDIKESVSYIKEYYDIKTKLAALDPRKDTAWATLLNSELQKLEPKVESIKKELSNIGDVDASGLKDLTDAISSGQAKLESATAKSFDKSSAKEYKAAINEVSKAISELYTEQNKLLKSHAGSDSNTYKTLADNVSSAKQKLDEAVASLQNFSQAQNVSISDTVTNGIHNITLQYDGQEESLKKLNEQLEIKNRNQNAVVSQKEDASLDATKIQEAVSALKDLNAARLEYERSKLKGASQDELSKQADQIRVLERNLQELQQVQLSSNQTVAQDAKYRSLQSTEYGNLNQEIKQLNAEYKNMNNGVGRLDDSLSSNLATLATAITSFQTLQEAISKIVDTAKELDDAMTEIQIVTQMSDARAQDLMLTYSEIAKELGTTTTAVAESSNEWLNCRVTLNPLNCGNILRDCYTNCA